MAVLGMACVGLVTPAAATPDVAGPSDLQPSGSVRTFEDEPVGEPPEGCHAPGTTTPALVSDIRGYESERSLRVYDPSDASQTAIVCPGPPQLGADLEFVVYPDAMPNGFIFSLLGHLEGIGGDPRLVFHLSVPQDGAVQWFDGLGWTRIAPPGTVDTGQWSTLRVQVPSDQQAAHIYVNGTHVGDAGPVGVRAVADVTAYQFASFGTPTQGEDIFIDDVAFGPAVDTPPDTLSEFDVGEDVTIDQTSGEPLQFPHTSVNVPGDEGTETLAAYVARDDAIDQTGVHVASTPDSGVTWQLDDERNPIPDAQSYYFTTLRNGDLLAISYLTFMTPHSQNLQADIESYLSTDGGQSWTARAGTMTAPQAMRPILPQTPRPGRPLGGFVLVHRLVEDSDGTLYQSGYGYYEDDPKYRQIVLKSTDGGVNWTTSATVAYDPDLSGDPRYEGFSEGGLERVADGSLLMVMRTGSYQPMYVSRSTDDGATWTEPEQLLAGPDAQSVTGIFPTLYLMPSGKLVLYIGRPGQSMLSSPDGNGETWTRPTTIDYLNSGNGNALPVGVHDLLVFGDRGAEWSTPRPATPRIWSRSVVVEKPCTNMVNGTHRGPLHVDAGTTCVEDATVTGPITVESEAALIVTASTIRGPISSNSAAAVSVCGSHVRGPIEVTGTSGAVMIGDRTRACAPPTLEGPLRLSGNEGLVVVDRIDARDQER